MIYRAVFRFLAIAAAAFCAAAAPKASAVVVTGVTIEDFSSELSSFNRLASRAIDGSGLTGAQHTNAANDAGIGTMWLTNGPQDPPPAHITFDLGQAYALTGIHVWNYNESGSFVSRGAHVVKILVSSDENVGNLTLLDNGVNDFLFTIATGMSDYTGFDLDLSGVANASLLSSVRLIRFDVQSNYGDVNQYVGLSEVQFIAAIPESSLLAAPPMAVLACVAAGQLRRRRRQSALAGVVHAHRYRGK